MIEFLLHAWLSGRKRQTHNLFSARAPQVQTLLHATGSACVRAEKVCTGQPSRGPGFLPPPSITPQRHRACNYVTCALCRTSFTPGRLNVVAHIKCSTAKPALSFGGSRGTPCRQQTRQGVLNAHHMINNTVALTRLSQQTIDQRAVLRL